MTEARNPKFQRAPLSGGPPPDLMKVAEETLMEFLDALVPYVLAIVGQMALVLPVVVVLMFGAFAVWVLGAVGAVGLAAGGALAEDAALGGFALLASLGSWAPVLLFLIVLGVVVVVLGPASASLVRATAAHQRGGPPLGAMATFSTFTQDVIPVVGCSALSFVLVLTGALFCYLPGLLASALAGLVLHLVAVDRDPVGVAFARVFGVLAQHPGWFALYAGAVGVLTVVASNVPVLGQAFVLAFTVRVARKLFGDPPA